MGLPITDTNGCMGLDWVGGSEPDWNQSRRLARASSAAPAKSEKNRGFSGASPVWIQLEDETQEEWGGLWGGFLAPAAR